MGMRVWVDHEIPEAEDDPTYLSIITHSAESSTTVIRHG